MTGLQKYIERQQQATIGHAMLAKYREREEALKNPLSIDRRLIARRLFDRLSIVGGTRYGFLKADGSLF